MKYITLFFLTFSGLILNGAENPPQAADAEKPKTIAQTVDDKTIIAATEAIVDTNFGPADEDQVDPRILRDFIESRGLIACRQKCGQLTLSGDVRAKYIAQGERVGDDKKVRGSGTSIPSNRFRSEFNFFIDYVDPKSWVSTKVKWTAADGIDGLALGTKTELDRAFVGMDIYECGKRDFYIELGRSRLEYIFDSRVEFSNFFDGIHLYYTDCWSSIGTFVAHGGPFVVDAITNHYAWVFETWVDDLGGTGFIVKYSLIDWNRHSPTGRFGSSTAAKVPGLGKTVKNNPRYRFLVSQMLFGWEGDIDFCRCKTLYLYGAVLANHDAKKSFTTDNKYANKAWYVGFTLGKLCKACDWSLDANYQYVQAQSVPEFDLSGIGHGNAQNGFLSDALIAGLSPGEAINFTNYKGFQVSLLYALTDALSLRTKGEWTTPITKRIGGDFNYKAFEMSAIYAF